MPDSGNISIEQFVTYIYTLAREMERQYPGRPFTPDGHMVGSIGEVVVSKMFDLELAPPSTKGYDATDKEGNKYEIKVTQGDRVAFRSCPENAIVGKLYPDGRLDVVYKGPGAPIWKEFEGKKRPSNGQYQISLKRIVELQNRKL